MVSGSGPSAHNIGLDRNGVCPVSSQCRPGLQQSAALGRSIDPSHGPDSASLFSNAHKLDLVRGAVRPSALRMLLYTTPSVQEYTLFSF